MSRFQKIENPVLAFDGGAVAVDLTFTDQAAMRLEIPVKEIGNLVVFFAQLNQFLAGHGAINPRRELVSGPIPVQNIAFDLSAPAGESRMALELAGCTLLFAFPPSKSAAVADEFSRIARAMAANTAKPPH
jgi:hypothetical protein